MAHRLSLEEYTVGWVCALRIELAAALDILDEDHGTYISDDNIYSLGSIGDLNVVIGSLPAGHTGTNMAATVATQMKSVFKGIRYGLMVGIGGGVPSAENDIRLGDVVVSEPHLAFSGSVQYDMGKETPSGFQRTGFSNSPPRFLLSAVRIVQSNEDKGNSKLANIVSALERKPKSQFKRRNAGPDVLYRADYDHQGGSTCEHCEASGQEVRPRRKRGEEIKVHYGTIASGNRLMRNASERNRISTDLGGVLCFEMEAAGLMNTFSCLVIRGVSDYADSHKNKNWQPYAAATAAAYAKEVLLVITEGLGGARAAEGSVSDGS